MLLLSFVNELVNFANILVLNYLAVDFTFILAFCLVFSFTFCVPCSLALVILQCWSPLQI